ncbi:MAG: hypothetical protein KDJ25_05410 [Rhodoblastus sp.]|nr:hypothetical protein [Rhodoblastus sp.]
MRASPLQNRVDPFGEIHATRERGLFYGNRGGRFHRDDQTLGTSRWKSKQWITCLCAFKGRRNAVFGKRYTDLFFLDEPTALAAGHRPCFECRRERALAYRNAIDPSGGLRAWQLDERLDAERRNGRDKRKHPRAIDGLPDGAIFCEAARAFAIRGGTILPWSFGGYGAPLTRPRNTTVACLTPPTSLAALSAGYTPEWSRQPVCS